MLLHEAIYLIEAMAYGAARWDVFNAPDASFPDMRDSHLSAAREAMAVLLAQDGDSADAVGVLDHLPSQPR